MAFITMIFVDRHYKLLLDGFVKSPTSALRFISLSLRRTLGTPHDTKFARLEFEAFYFAIAISTFHEFVKIDY